MSGDCTQRECKGLSAVPCSRGRAPPARSVQVLPWGVWMVCVCVCARVSHRCLVSFRPGGMLCVLEGGQGMMMMMRPNKGECKACWEMSSAFYWQNVGPLLRVLCERVCCCMCVRARQREKWGRAAVATGKRWGVGSCILHARNRVSQETGRGDCVDDKGANCWRCC